MTFLRPKGGKQDVADALRDLCQAPGQCGTVDFCVPCLGANEIERLRELNAKRLGEQGGA